MTQPTHATAQSNPVDEFDLGSLDDAYRDAPDEDAPVPDGRYPVTVERVALKRSKSSGAKMLEWELRITGSAFAGRKLWKYTLLGTADHMVWAKRDLKACGLEIERISELPSRLNDLLDVTLDVVVKTRDEYQNIYFRRPEGSSGSASATRQGERPF